MRTYPNVWVPPGGGSEESETIIETGLREVKEETGLDLSNCGVKFALPLCLWESVYPPLLAKGDPKRHQMVVYLHIYIERNSLELNEEIKLDPQETDAWMWMDRNEIQAATNYSVPLCKDSKLVVYEMENNKKKTLGKNYSLLRAEVPDIGSFDVERISTGTRFALEMFEKKKNALPKL